VARYVPIGQVLVLIVTRIRPSVVALLSVARCIIAAWL